MLHNFLEKVAALDVLHDEMERRVGLLDDVYEGHDLRVPQREEKRHLPLEPIVGALAVALQLELREADGFHREEFPPTGAPMNLGCHALAELLQEHVSFQVFRRPETSGTDGVGGSRRDGTTSGSSGVNELRAFPLRSSIARNGAAFHESLDASSFKDLQAQSVGKLLPVRQNVTEVFETRLRAPGVHLLRVALEVKLLEPILEIFVDAGLALEACEQAATDISHLVLVHARVGGDEERRPLLN
mmetsp:Transcript_20633/g.57461  ORF Transcript_20633/g.57461 Transcript_20633/m.57461 type:complete len:244 (+) Transcript_20633:995-1726(+)